MWKKALFENFEILFSGAKDSISIFICLFLTNSKKRKGSSIEAKLHPIKESAPNSALKPIIILVNYHIGESKTKSKCPLKVIKIKKCSNHCYKEPWIKPDSCE